MKRLEELEASIERQSVGIKTFDPSVPMIGIDSNRKCKESSRSADNDLNGNADESGSMDADITGNSGSEVTEVMVELDDSTAEAPLFGARWS